MAVYRKQDLNPDMDRVKLSAYFGLVFRLVNKKRTLEMKKQITIITDDNIYHHEMNTDNFFKKKKE